LIGDGDYQSLHFGQLSLHRFIIADTTSVSHRLHR
jgi:hypothetical protein